jgi:hypothetical protein
MPRKNSTRKNSKYLRNNKGNQKYRPRRGIFSRRGRSSIDLGLSLTVNFPQSFQVGRQILVGQIIR